MIDALLDGLVNWYSETFVDHLNTWVLIGFAGQIAFMSRFLVQWIASERAGRSIVPVSFWFLSIAGALILFSYAVSRQDPVFIIGQSMGLFVYIRNLILIRRERSAKR